MLVHQKKTMKLLGPVAAACLSLAAAMPASAEDKIILKDGRVLTGEIVREIDGFLWFRVNSVDPAQFFSTEDIRTIERDTGSAKPATATPTAATPAPTALTPVTAPAASEPVPEPVKSVGPGAPKAVVITLGENNRDMVGMYMTAHSLREAIPVLKKDGVDIVVFRINSGGGALLEIQRLSDVIHNEYKKEFRVVAWIESAISAAAMTAHCIEEIYFTPEGNYGACTGWFGALTAVSGRDLEVVYAMMEKISARGGYAPEIMKAMQHTDYQLSCSIDANGDVHWEVGDGAQFVVNPKDRILTFDSQEALRYKFSKGTAETLAELEKAMGLTEVEWLGERRKGFMWPIHRAEQMQMDYRAQVAKDESQSQEYFFQYNASVQLARGEQDKTKRGAFVGRARRNLDQIKGMVDNAPNLALFVVGVLPEQFYDWYNDQQELLREIMR